MRGMQKNKADFLVCFLFCPENLSKKVYFLVLSYFFKFYFPKCVYLLLLYISKLNILFEIYLI